jgi:fumarylacetoacetate (FAA) hydrolase
VTSRTRLRLATIHDGSRDGKLVLVNPSGTRCAPAAPEARTLQQLLDSWNQQAPALSGRYADLERNGWSTCAAFDSARCAAPLPRAYQWVDASVYRNHAKLLYEWRKEPIPETYEKEPLVYQGGSDVMLGPHADIEGFRDEWDVDFEAEIGVITGDVPLGATPETAAKLIRLVVLLNDVSLRGLIPVELRKGFGFYQSKPSTAFAPVAVTPELLGEAWVGGMLKLPVRISLNGKFFGAPWAHEDVAFSFPQIISHCAKTRALSAGTIVGAGTVSNADPAAGSACITEARMRAQIAGRGPSEIPAYLRIGDRVRIEVIDPAGNSVFGAIDQTRT